MFFIWGKREVLSTFDMQAYFQAEQKLTQASIPHYSKMTSNRFGNFGNQYAMPARDVKYTTQYRIFVPKDRVQEAVYHLHKSEEFDD